MHSTEPDAQASNDTPHPDLKAQLEAAPAAPLARLTASQEAEALVSSLFDEVERHEKATGLRTRRRKAVDRPGFAKALGAFVLLMLRILLLRSEYGIGPGCQSEDEPSKGIVYAKRGGTGWCYHLDGSLP